MSLKLYFAPGACSLASLVALEETGVGFEAARLILANGEQKQAEYLAVNPRGRVPALIADGQVVTESIAVLTYLAHRFPAAALLPLDNPLLLARAYELMSWFASNIHISIAQIWRGERFTSDEEAKKTLQRDGKLNILRAYAELETVFTGEWILGDRFSVVDPYAYVFWRWGLRLELDMTLYPNWSEHTKRVLERPSVQRAIQCETP